MEGHSNNFNKVLANKRKNQSERKNTITEMKNILERFSSRIDEGEERISNLKDRAVELIQTERQKEKNDFKKVKMV